MKRKERDYDPNNTYQQMPWQQKHINYLVDYINVLLNV